MSCQVVQAEPFTTRLRFRIMLLFLPTINEGATQHGLDSDCGNVQQMRSAIGDHWVEAAQVSFLPPLLQCKTKSDLQARPSKACTEAHLLKQVAGTPHRLVCQKTVVAGNRNPGYRVAAGHCET